MISIQFSRICIKQRTPSKTPPQHFLAVASPSIVLGMVEDEVALVVHREFRMSLEGEDVFADAEAFVTAEVAGGEGRRAFRKLQHLIVVVDDEGHFPRCGLPNPVLQRDNPRQVIVGGVVGTGDDVEGAGLEPFGQLAVHHPADVEGEIGVDRAEQVIEHRFVTRDALREQSGVRVAEQKGDFVDHNENTLS